MKNWFKCRFKGGYFVDYNKKGDAMYVVNVENYDNKIRTFFITDTDNKKYNIIRDFPFDGKRKNRTVFVLFDDVNQIKHKKHLNLTEIDTLTTIKPNATVFNLRD